MMAIDLPDGLTTLAARFKWAREFRGMSQSSLSRATKTATQAAISNVAIWKIEAGESQKIQAGTLFRLAAALEINPDWLRTGTGHPFSLTENENALMEASRLMANLTEDKQLMILAAIRAISDK